MAILGGFLATQALENKASALLAERGCQVESSAWSGPRLLLEEITCPGLQVTRAELNPWPRTLLLSGVDLDIAGWLPTIGSQAQAPGGPPAPSMASIAQLAAITRVEGMRLRVGGLVLAEELRGSLSPMDLSGEGLRLRQADAGYHLELQRSLVHTPLKGPLELVLDWSVDSGEIGGSISGRGLRLDHPLLAADSLPDLSLRGSFAGHDGGLERPWLQGQLHLGGPTLTWGARIDEGGLPVLELELPDSPAQEVLVPLEPLVPELDQARVSGTIGASARWSPRGTHSAELRLQDLAVSGAVEPGLDLQWGAFTTMVLDEHGERVPRRTGDNTPGWTPLSQVSPDLVHALLAAEDSAFFRHAGYDPEAIQAALDADIEAGLVLRGGSTISQQLAKNLFLDGEQTLVRKLRELLLAVELDRSLGKERVLELYLNVVEFGPGIHGIGAACEVYFMKRPSRVSPLEAAFLAALLPSPRRYHERWYLDGRPNRTRLQGILDNMVDGGWLGIREAQRLGSAELILVPPPR